MNAPTSMLKSKDQNAATQQLSAKQGTLGSDELHKIDAYWRAANYLSVGQIYLYDNPLLREPLRLAHVKPLVVGHWGTTPGQNFIYVHLNRVIKKHDLDMFYIAGPGHGGPALVANTYLEGSYSEIYPDISQDEAGMKRLFKQFSFPGGISSHVAPTTPGSIHEGGELGYSLSHAFGAAFDNPGLIVACIVGDGEAETGPLAPETCLRSSGRRRPSASGSPARRRRASRSCSAAGKLDEELQCARTLRCERNAESRTRRPGPAFGGSEDDHRPARSRGVFAFSRALLDCVDLADGLFDRRRHQSVHLFRLFALDEERRPAAALEELFQFLVLDTREDCRVADLETIEVQDWQNRSVRDRIEKFVGLPGGRLSSLKRVTSRRNLPSTMVSCALTAPGAGTETAWSRKSGICRARAEGQPSDGRQPARQRRDSSARSEFSSIAEQLGDLLSRQGLTLQLPDLG
jgi:hypothetical protein